MMKNTRKYVIVDIDGTVADVRHRLHHIKGPGKKNWKAFFEGMDRDKPLLEMLDHVRNLSSKHRILIVTGRPEHYRTRTEAWLKKHGVKYERLYMRKSGDHRPDYESKSAVLHEIDPKDIVLAIDDRLPVCEMWEKHGIKCQLVESDEQNQEVNELYRKQSKGAKSRNKRKS
jgi:uncharacterized HAD superfamily protein